MTRRRPLSAPRGAITSDGKPVLATALSEALREGHDPEKHLLTHGFHSYAGGLHPLTARRLVSTFTRPGETLLDPFCGAGTVLVEARLHGVAATGADINPVALWIASVRVEAPSAEGRARFLAAASAMADLSEDRVRTRVPARAPLSKTEIQYWDAHVLLELAGLREEILQEPNTPLREALFVVFSSLLIKLSRQRADTDEEVVQRTIRKGLPTELFLRKARELADRWESFEKELSARVDGGSPELIRADVRDLPERLPPGSFDCVITSPPYGGTYNYVDHHARRYAWWGIDPEEIEQAEIGARRTVGRAARPEIARQRWNEEVREALSATATCVRPGGRIVLIMGDAEAGGTRIPADTHLADLSAELGLLPLAVASETRPDRLGGSRKREHILAFEVPSTRHSRPRSG